jgi:Abortive infection C-terminus
MDNDELLELIETLQNMMRAQAIGEPGDQREYARLRKALMESDNIRPLLPRWIKTHPTLTSFEETMKTNYPRNYKGRREAIKEAFEPILAKLTNQYVVPIDSIVAEEIDLLGLEYAKLSWERTLARIKSEPDAAITSARTLVESVCKSILEKYQVDQSEFERLNLQALFLKAWNELNSKQQANPLDRIQSKLNDLIAAFGALRNQYGDAHGRGGNFSPPTQIEAELVVNLAGTIALLLIRRWQEVNHDGL